ncbi:FecR family protein [Mucilaginibacter sp. OK098]|uniref:FecR family protein n=1 Tax=Mucilaginibacter sp. OK098 TaxID=1855297 RepID=UPI0009115FC7|nr:FecR domain-containing protein [Mucilaginibacter sp. OK098]SHM58710.1 FecR family protein [Mucilaginibacter sp. OK098]
MKKRDAKDLISKYLRDDISPEERVLVEQWFIKDLKDSHNLPTHDRIEAADKRVRENLLKHIGEQKSIIKPINIWPRFLAAASILLFVAIGGYYILHKSQVKLQMAANNIHDIAPGGNKAILTLANGKQIVLTGAKNGRLAMQGNIAVTKSADGELVYDSQPANVTGEITYNTMATPRGGQYHLKLADGTNVWLNAASSIKYPTTFAGKSREVEITGEAYFEVVHNAAMPFRVISNGQKVEVLGTHFNVNTYIDEPAIKTTLIEGSVKVTTAKHITMLKPGQQAVINSEDNTPIKIIDNADAEQVLAWKNEEFNFSDTDIQTVMRQIGRWYDVDIEYAGKIPGDRLSGTFSRNLTASKALKLLKFSGINFKIEGRKIIVN